MNEKSCLDLARVICPLEEIPDGGSLGFTIGAGDWPLRGFLVRMRDDVKAYVNRCPHARHPLNLRPNRFLTHDSSLILCSSHGALFEKSTGYCVAGPCAGQSLEPIKIELVEGYVLLEAGLLETVER
jgi:nitrite reductase/ring-hydroxylating ferredoxin subunit